MTAITRRVLASVAAAAGVAAPVVGGVALVSSATAAAQPPVMSQDEQEPPPPPPVLSGTAEINVGVPTAPPAEAPEEEETTEPSVDAIQEALDSIGSAEDATALNDKLEDHIKTLDENKPAVPPEALEDFDKFLSLLEGADEAKSLEGDKADDTLKTIQTDAATLSGQLKALG